MVDIPRDVMRGTTDADRGLAPKPQKPRKAGPPVITPEERKAFGWKRKEGLRHVAGRLWDQISSDDQDRGDWDPSDPDFKDGTVGTRG